MSRNIYEKRNLMLSRHAGPGGIKMIQLTVDERYIQLSEAVFEQMLVEMKHSLDRE